MSNSTIKVARVYNMYFFLRPFSTIKSGKQSQIHHFFSLLFAFVTHHSNISVVKTPFPPVKRQAVIRNAPDALHTDIDVYTYMYVRCVCVSQKRRKKTRTKL